MAYYKNRGFEINENKTADFLENAVHKITTEEDIDTLTKLIKLYKKNVPLSRRKYVAAFLLQEALKHYHPTSKFTSNSRTRSNDDSKAYKSEYKNTKKELNTKIFDTDEPVKHTRVIIDPAEATSVFIGIGKNRRVYPRDLVGLLIAVAELSRERIGDIKVLANYSFVQLYTSDAPKVIEKLNGYDYRGRKLVVSFSQQKKEFLDNNESYDDDQMGEEDAQAYALAEKAAVDKEPFGSI